MIAAGDIVRIDGRETDFRVSAVGTGWDPGTYTVTLEGGNTRVVLRDCYEDAKGQVHDSVGGLIVKVGHEPEAPDPEVNEDGQLEIF